MFRALVFDQVVAPGVGDAAAVGGVATASSGSDVGARHHDVSSRVRVIFRCFVGVYLTCFAIVQSRVEHVATGEGPAGSGSKAGGVYCSCLRFAWLK
jgi:hypothetical protein